MNAYYFKPNRIKTAISWFNEYKIDIDEIKVTDFSFKNGGVNWIVVRLNRNNTLCTTWSGEIKIVHPSENIYIDILGDRDAKYSIGRTVTITGDNPNIITHIEYDIKSKSYLYKFHHRQGLVAERLLDEISTPGTKEVNKFSLGQIVWLSYDEHEYIIRKITKNLDAENPFEDIYIYDLWNKEVGYKYSVKEENLLKTQGHNMFKKGKRYKCSELVNYDFTVGKMYTSPKDGKLISDFNAHISMETDDYKKFRLIENSSQTEVTDTEENEWSESNDDTVIKEGDIVKCIIPDEGRNTSKGYSYGHYYLVKEFTHDHIITYLDDNSSTGNGWNLSNFIVVDKCKVTKFIPDRQYMCIKQINTIFTKGNKYISSKEDTLITNNGNKITMTEDHYDRFVEIIDTSKDENPPFDWDDDDDESDIPEPETLPPELLDVDIKTEMKYMFPMPILLEGPVGVGKSTLVMELADELGLEYFASVLTDGTSKTEFTGYKNVMNGEYISTEFRRCFEFGGLYNLEELNATTANLPIIFNTIENGYFVFADKTVQVHPDFRLVATMNTITNAKDFGGRREVDKSVRNRFHRILMKAADKSRFEKATVIYAEAINDLLDNAGITDLVDPRDMMRFEHMCKNKDISKEICLRKCMVNERIKISDDDLRKIIKTGREWK